MVVVETDVFTKLICELLGDDDYREFQLALVNRPDTDQRTTESTQTNSDEVAVMEPSSFDKLISSVREMDNIAKGRKKASR